MKGCPQPEGQLPVFSRRPLITQNRRLQSGQTGETPLTIIGAPAKQYHVLDAANVALSGASITAIEDLTTNNNDSIQGTGANQPTFEAAAGPGGTSCALYDGVNDFVAAAALNLAAPGTTPWFLWAIVQQVSWLANDSLCGGVGAANAGRVRQAGASPNLESLNGGTGPQAAGGTVGSYFRLIAQFTNSTSDRMKCGATNVTGANAGNTASTGRQIGAQNSLNFANIRVREWLISTGNISSYETSLDAYVAATYPGTVLL